MKLRTSRHRYLASSLLVAAALGATTLSVPIAAQGSPLVEAFAPQLVTVDGQDTPDGTCAAFSATSNGGFGVGVDPHRNYGGFWGGPGASETFADPTYRGAGPISEPETQNVRDLISTRQVTMMISNNGYANIHGWELYDTTGTTDDWSYNSTGGYAFTFEIGPDEFHPPFAQVVDEYVGTGPYAGKGNREAYLVAFENAVSRTSHALISGKAPAGATLRLRKEFTTPTWSPENNFNDALESTMVTTGRSFAWDVNQSTRPVVQSRLIKLLNETPTRSETFTEIGSSGNFVGEKEKATINAPTPGTYVLRVINFASVTPTYTLTASLFNATEQTTPPQIESWTLTCEKDGQVLQTASIVIDRGQQVSIDLKECGRRCGR